MNKSLFADLVLLFVTFIWGTTFVIVQNAVNVLPPHSFNGMRFGIASFALLLVIFLKDKKSLLTFKKKGWIAGIIIGLLLFAGYAFQTIGLLYTTASKAGFITGLSVIMVPIFSIFILKIIPKWPTVLGVAFAAIGLYLLTMVDVLGLQLGDLLVFFCTIFFALQIIFVGKYAPDYSALPLAFVQISTVAVASFVFAFFFEDIRIMTNPDYLFASDVVVALIITSLFATAFAFYVQTSLQKYTTPTRVAVIFAMEPVFAAVTSYFIQGEVFTLPAVLGGMMIFMGMILAETPVSFLRSLVGIRQKSPEKQAEISL